MHWFYTARRDTRSRKTLAVMVGRPNRQPHNKQCRKRHLKYQKWTAHPKNK
jgi:hypothetical protein